MDRITVLCLLLLAKFYPNPYWRRWTPTLLLKTETKHTPLSPPRPAHRTTGAVQKDPAEANTPYPSSWHLMPSTPWQPGKRKPRGTAGPLFPSPPSTAQRGCYNQLGFLMPLQGSSRCKALSLAFTAQSVIEAAAVSCQSDCIQFMFPTFILSLKG